MKISDAKISMLMESIGYPIAEWDRPALIHALKEMSGYTRETFRTAKSNLNAYIRKNVNNKDAERMSSLLFNISYSDIDIRESIRDNYFQSESDFQYFLDLRVSRLAAEKGVNPDNFLITKVVLYLAWVGISSDEVPEILRENVSVLGTDVATASGKYTFPSSMANEIARLRDLTEYSIRVKRGGKNVDFTSRLVESAYFLRTVKSEKITKRFLFDRISLLNETIRDNQAGKRFSYEKVKESGYFSRAREDENRNGAFYHATAWEIDDAKRAAQLLGVDGDNIAMTQLYSKLMAYLMYKETILKM